ncbi:MAG: hypothetical protein HY939_01655 [Gammaproteobacteria bacterium]|nr:hypothetical protein [Gammaproteobacteria bacterium]
MTKPIVIQGVSKQKAHFVGWVSKTHFHILDIRQNPTFACVKQLLQPETLSQSTLAERKAVFSILKEIDHLGLTFLQFAILALEDDDSVKEVLTRLVAHENEDVNALSTLTHDSALHIATLLNFPKTMDALLELGAVPDIINDAGYPPLALAVYLDFSGHLAHPLLTHHNIDPLIPFNGADPFREILTLSDPVIVSAFLNHPIVGEELTDLVDEAGGASVVLGQLFELFLLTKTRGDSVRAQNFLSILTSLVEKGLDPYEQSNADSPSLIMLSIFHKEPRVFDAVFIAERDISVSRTNYHCVDLVLQCADLPFFKHIARTQKPYLNYLMQTDPHFAVKVAHSMLVYNHFKALDWLFLDYPNLAHIDISPLSNGGTLLFSAVLRGLSQSVLALCQRGANPNIALTGDYYGPGSNKVALPNNFPALVFSPSIYSTFRVKKGATPLRIALLNRDWDNVFTLLFYGAKFSLHDKEALHPVLLALRYKKIELIRLILKKASPQQERKILLYFIANKIAAYRLDTKFLVLEALKANLPSLLKKLISTHQTHLYRATKRTRTIHYTVLPQRTHLWIENSKGRSLLHIALLLTPPKKEKEKTAFLKNQHKCIQLLINEMKKRNSARYQKSVENILFSIHIHPQHTAQILELLAPKDPLVILAILDKFASPGNTIERYSVIREIMHVIEPSALLRLAKQHEKTNLAQFVTQEMRNSMPVADTSPTTTSTSPLTILSTPKAQPKPKQPASTSPKQAVDSAPKDTLSLFIQHTADKLLTLALPAKRPFSPLDRAYFNFYFLRLLKLIRSTLLTDKDIVFSKQVPSHYVRHQQKRTLELCIASFMSPQTVITEEEQSNIMRFVKEDLPNFELFILHLKELNFEDRCSEETKAIQMAVNLSTCSDAILARTILPYLDALKEALEIKKLSQTELSVFLCNYFIQLAPYLSQLNIRSVSLKDTLQAWITHCTALNESRAFIFLPEEAGFFAQHNQKRFNGINTTSSSHSFPSKTLLPLIQALSSYLETELKEAEQPLDEKNTASSPLSLFFRPLPFPIKPPKTEASSPDATSSPSAALSRP